MIVKVKTAIKNPLILGYFLFKLKVKYPQYRDHSIITQLLREEFNLDVTKEDIDRHYGFDDTVIECYEDESRIQEYKLKLI